MAQRLRFCLLGVVALGLAYGPAVDTVSAQYFGRNKVQYEDLDFEVLKTTHFDIYYYPEEREAVEHAARMAERWYVRLTSLLNHEFQDRQPIILYSSHPHFRQTNVVSGFIGEGTGGLTEPLKRRIVQPFAGSLAETDHVLGHELVHAFQFDILNRVVRQRGAARLPLWFIEGMAEYLSVGANDPHTTMWVRDALQSDRMPAIRQLTNPRFFPYRFGQALWAYIGGRFGDDAIGRILRRPGPGGAVRGLILETGLSEKQLTEDWHGALRAAYEPLLEVTSRPERFADLLLSENNSGRINLAPALSPDGSSIAFLSEKSQFAIEIFLADARTGEVKRKVVETAFDPHFESLQFINSAGAWDWQGRRFAFAAISAGQPIVTIIDVESGKKLRELKFPDLGEIFNPSWSPDGRYIAFSAIRGGLSDLYMYDLQRGILVQLTDDAFADLQPTWSPDGRTIAFVTDRFGTDLERLDYGEYRLALLTPPEGQITELPALEDGKHINPQWGPEGNNLYFISDRNGISNVYRLALRSGDFFQVTDVFTGVSGITPLSPAISVASRSGKLAFSIYQNDGYRIYVTDSDGVLEGTPPRPQVAGLDAAALPPIERESQVLTFLRNPGEGLPATDTTRFETEDYSAGLSLDYVAQPEIVAGADRFGAFVGGGTALFFSDMLGNHLLGTFAQVNGTFDSFTGAVSYQNKGNRLIWGGTAQRIPFIFQTFSLGEATVNGEPALVQQIFRFQQTNYRVSATAWYPFSTVQRAEFTAGYRHIDFDLNIRTLAVSQRTGQLLLDEEQDSSLFDALNLGTASAALVYDNSFFGATSPIRGQRYRFEIEPTAGSLNFVQGLADFRRYWMPVQPVTFAFRGLHFGRYGGDAEDERLRDLFIGFPGLIRGYDDETFDIDECQPVAGDPCPVFNQLFGSRLLVGNAEVRFPMFGILGLGEGYYGFFPVEMAIFADAGLAWQDDIEATQRDEDAFFFGGDREPVFSAGFTWRTNLLGFLVLQFDFARAFARDKWVTQFSFLPGF